MGMRDVMTTKGGFCANSGPYVISSECSSGQVKLLTFGMIGLFVFGGVYFAFMSWYEAPLLGPLLFMWAALFGALGWNFIDLGINKPPGQTSTGGWIVSGVVFWAMALGGLIPAVALAVGWLKRGGGPEPPVFHDDGLVRAAVHPVATAASPSNPNVPSRLVIPPKKWEEPPT